MCINCLFGIYFLVTCRIVHFQNAVNQQQFYIDITSWVGNGLYFVRIIDPQGNTVDIKKIVLQ
jgi:hypothetical protein